MLTFKDIYLQKDDINPAFYQVGKVKVIITLKGLEVISLPFEESIYILSQRTSIVNTLYTDLSDIYSKL